jgi:hypothetical protein
MSKTSHRRSRLTFSVGALLLAMSMISIAPANPNVKAASAGICTMAVDGGRSTDTSAWGFGLMRCTGPVAITMQLRLERCWFDVAGACGVWVPVSGIMAARSGFGGGPFYIPESGNAHQGGLLNDNIYHLVLTVSATPVGGWTFAASGATLQWRQ